MTAAPQTRSRGAIVGSYELLEPIGSGGMGEVWKARDRLLDRLVALKFLSKQDGRHDLIHEARAASALNHPNIVTIFQVGESDGDTCLAMEFVEGESLRRHVNATGDLSEALDISEQIVDGLASAHARGIIHRDLKPENIMIRADGCVKLVDFGLAKRLALADESTVNTPTKAISQSGELVGTFSYMSPEQARGHAIGPPSDVFSLGTVMYELFSGQHPFRRGEVLDTLNAIVREEPKPLAQARRDAPASVGSIVSKALQKEPSHRYSSAVEITEPIKQARREWDRSATEMTAALPRATASKWGRVIGSMVIAGLLLVSGWSVLKLSSSAGAVTPAVRSIAVMPFRTTDQNAQLIAEELPEDLGSALTKAGFQIASRASVSQMGATDTRSTGAELSVDAVLDGTVRAQGGLIRIYIELVNTRTGFQVWSNTFTVDNDALIAGRSTIATDIANQVRAAAGGQP